jgi:hypothetical protein
MLNGFASYYGLFFLLIFGFGKVFGIHHVHPLGKPFLNSIAFNFVHVYASFTRSFQEIAGLLATPMCYAT